MLTKLFALFPVNSSSIHSYKYIRFKHCLESRFVLFFLDSCSTTASIKRDYTAASSQQSPKYLYTMSKAVSAGFLTRLFSNLVQSAIKGVPAIESVHTLSRSYECGYNSVKDSKVLHKEVLRQTLYFSSSATRNIVDSSNSSAKPNILKRLYQKVMPEKLRFSKTTLRIGGATLSACCTHKVSIL